MLDKIKPPWVLNKEFMVISRNQCKELMLFANACKESLRHSLQMTNMRFNQQELCNFEHSISLSFSLVEISFHAIEIMLTNNTCVTV